MTPRGFPAFAPGRVRRPRTWWATAWNRAWEADALDAGPLRAGRRLATAGHVGPITVSPGRLAAAVHDGDAEQAYDTRIRVAPLGDDDWARLAGEVAARAGHQAALLAGQLPRDLAEATGVPLLPGLGELTPECDCPGWDHPCRHAAALCHQVSWLLDTDPTLLLLIRGREARTLVTAGAGAPAPAVIATGTGPASSRRSTEVGTAAAEAYAQAVPPLPPGPGPVADGPTLPLLPPGPDVDVDALRSAVAVAAGRAAALLQTHRGADAAPVSTGRDPANVTALSDLSVTKEAGR
ncbi:SWIM zinc finger family protein [Micromonospora echinofusca]|uniref:SWIM zinc finger family protein n=1 Tax=Micromonospora echinofusca TaxID=47858 RepID=UPI0033D85E02